MLETSNPNLLKTIFNPITAIVEEIEIKADNEGIRLNAMNKGHTTFIHLHLEDAIFDEYECTEPERICVDTGELMKILKRAKTRDTVKWMTDEGNLQIVFDGEAKRTFKIRLIDIEYESPEPPRINLPVQVNIPVTLLKDMVDDVSLYSDKIHLHADEDYLKASADGDFGDARIEYVHGCRVDDSVESVFSLEMVRDMLRADKVSSSVTLYLGDTVPLRLVFDVNGGGELSFILAPRIEEG